MRLFLTLCFLLGFATPSVANDLLQIDQAVIRAHPEYMRRVALRVGEPTPPGYIGRNREWGGLYSVRFQYGAGRALRYGIATNDSRVIRFSSKAIDVSLDTIEADGAFPISLPDEMAETYKPGPSDQASAAAFFLSDICPAFMLVQLDDSKEEAIRQAMSWLSDRTDILKRKDRLAPNRLLINALAFHSCGAVLSDPDLQRQAEDFISMALTQFENGIFVERGGSDTSYQAVSLVAISDLLATGYDGDHAKKLETVFEAGGDWLYGQIEPDGVLDSSDNTRTCADEHFLSKPKSVDLIEVFRALAYREILDETAESDLTAYKTWLTLRPDPCASRRE